LLFLGWIVAVLVITYMAHRLRIDSGQISSEKTNPVWGHAFVFFALIFLGGPVIGPIAPFLAVLLAGVTSLSSLRAPKPIPIVVFLLHGALIGGLFLLRAENIEKVKQAGGHEVWTLLHQRPDSRAVVRLVHNRNSRELETLLEKAKANRDVPEEMISWLERRVEGARREEESEKKTIQDRREKAERRQQERQKKALENRD
jgi:hypothetical protein